MQLYVDFTNDIAMDAEIDPITMDTFEGKDGHPRSVITLRGSNGVPRPYLTTTVKKMLDLGLKDPFTRRPFTALIKSRVNLYLQSLKGFPEYTIGMLEQETGNIFNKWIATYSDDCKLSKMEIYKTRVLANCFLQAEDLAFLFSKYHGGGSMENRRLVINDLSDNMYSDNMYSKDRNISWILRKCSVVDTEYDKAYVISQKVGNRVRHLLIIHRIGEGFYFNVSGIGRGMPANTPITSYESSHPTIIDILEKFM